MDRSLQEPVPEQNPALPAPEGMPHPLVFIIVLKSTSNTMHSIYILVLAYLSVIFLRHCLKARARSKELQKLAAEHGCAPAPSLDGRFSWGISLLREWIQADSQHRLMQLILFHMRQSGWTIHQQLLNQTILVTVDPANLEAMLNSKAGDYSVGRHQAATPLFGDGVFTLDGEAWRRSRALIRPHLAVLREVLRLYPPAPVNARTAARDTGPSAGSTTTTTTTTTRGRWGWRGRHAASPRPAGV
ncbi:hypothetical protein RB598_006585 [Gaeumannomyces tritici]